MVQSSKDLEKVYALLERNLKGYTIPIAEQIDVKTKDPFFVLIGTILSARTKDETTAKVCDRLFKEIRSFDDLEKASLSKLEKLIYGVGFYKTKAKHLKELPWIIKNEFDGQIPKTIDELVMLPGVGRKTANLVVSVAFKEPAICVDTHVHKIINRLGWIKTKTPAETEKELRKSLPKKYWSKTNYLFVMLGQNICKPVSPFCSKCFISKYCKKIGVKKSR